MVAEIELQTKSINQSMYIRRYIYIHTHVHHIYIQNMYIVHVIIFSIYTHAYIYICNEIAFRLPEAVLGTRFTWKATGQEAQWSYRVAPGVPGLRWKEGSSQLSTWPRLPTPRRQLRCKDLTPHRAGTGHSLAQPQEPVFLITIPQEEFPESPQGTRPVTRTPSLSSAPDMVSYQMVKTGLVEVLFSNQRSF